MERLDKKRIIELITEQRRSRDLSFDDMGNILHVSGRTVRRWERGEQTPTIDDVINLCNEFGISFDEIFNEKTDGSLNDDKTINTDMESISRIVSSTDRRVRELSREVNALKEQVRTMGSMYRQSDSEGDLTWLWLFIIHLAATVIGFLCYARGKVGYQLSFVSTLVYAVAVSFLIWHTRNSRRIQKMFMLYSLVLAVNMLFYVLLETELFGKAERAGEINLNNVELILVNGALYGLRRLGLYNTRRFLFLCFLCYGVWIIWSGYNLLKDRSGIVSDDKSARK
ncbi:MAG: helix-turn-helix transcriptional regulator [Erysipelotrichaceae bacterium]|nr:helix-turn-helix transcriptional regulator [Erysipelotrichaceae bacterium]